MCIKKRVRRIVLDMDPSCTTVALRGLGNRAETRKESKGLRQIDLLIKLTIPWKGAAKQNYCKKCFQKVTSFVIYQPIEIGFF